MEKILGPIALLKKGWDLYIKNWGILMPIVAVPVVLSTIGSLLALGDRATWGIIGFILIIIGAIFNIALMPALADAVRKLSQSTGEAVTIFSQYKIGFSLFWSVILLYMISGFVSLGSFLLLIVPGIVIAIYTSASLFTFTIDGKRGFSALSESYALVRGREWGVLGRILVFAIASMVIYLIVSGAFHLPTLIAGIPWSTVMDNGRYVATPIGSVLSIIVSMIVNLIVGPLIVGSSYNLYLELKRVKVTDIDTKIFKRWLVAFLCVGIIVPILMLVSSIVLVSLNSARIKSSEVRLRDVQAEEKMRAEILIQNDTVKIGDGVGNQQ